MNSQNKPKKIYVGSDHAGYSLKGFLIESLKSQGLNLEDLGCFSEKPVDYPEIAKVVAERVSSEEAWGILVCGTGIGQSISANKIRGVRAAVAWDVTSARLSRAHNDANILCLGARLLGSGLALEICQIWVSTDFEGGRHQKRLDLIGNLERKT